MNRLVLAALVAPLAFAGCFGNPPGEGDVVAIRVSATDLETGDTLVSEIALALVIGENSAGLGHDLDNALRNRAAGDSFTLESRGDDGRVFLEEVVTSRLLPPFPVYQDVTVATFQFYIGVPSPGLMFPYSFYEGTVDRIEDDRVFFQVDAQPGQRDELEVIGAVLVTNRVGDDLERALEPVPGARFTIHPPEPGEPTALDLAVGSYEMVGARGDELVLRYSPSPHAELVGRDIQFEVTVLSVSSAGLPNEPVDGNYAAGRSPQILEPSLNSSGGSAL